MNTRLVTTKVDRPYTLSVSTTAMPDGDTSRVVATTFFTFGDGEQTNGPAFIEMGV